MMCNVFFSKKDRSYEPILLNDVNFSNTKIMFGLFKKDPVKALEKKYQKLMEEAMHIQRGGDIKGYAAKMAEAEEVQKEIEKLEAEKK
ncbi:MAG: hypothetical protein Sapg2KO_08590 [Saprospiraceae bacterium]